MRIRRKDDWDDDWDDEVVVKKKPPGPSLLTTRRILWGLAALAVAALLLGSVVSRDEFQFKETPTKLIGMWTCGDPEKSDFWVEFRPQFVIFGTGGTGTMKYRILGFKFEQVGELERYTVFYKDLAGKQHTREIVLPPSGDTLRFADEPGVNWTRFDR
jgi:hypothetical protein